MNLNLVEKLTYAQKKFNSLVCGGVDPDLSKIPMYLRGKHSEDINGLYTEFCIQIVDAIAPHCCAFKPNLPFFLEFDTQGLEALKNVVTHIHKHYPDHVLVVDGKYNDIGNTAGKYAAFLKTLGADVVTTPPYMGLDTMGVYLKEGMGIFALCLTSNDGVVDFQKFKGKNGRYLYEEVALKVKEEFGVTGDAGLVVGATHPEELKSLRDLVGDEIVFLIPGLGTQGGEPVDIVMANGRGLAIINTSRSVMYASDGKDFAEAAGKKAEGYKKEINSYLSKVI